MQNPSSLEYAQPQLVVLFKMANTEVTLDCVYVLKTLVGMVTKLLGVLFHKDNRDLESA